MEDNIKDFREYEIIIKIKQNGIEYESKIVYTWDTHMTTYENITRISEIIDYKIIIPFFKKGVK